MPLAVRELEADLALHDLDQHITPLGLHYLENTAYGENENPPLERRPVSSAEQREPLVGG
jgi:hypothetical protein